MATLDAPTQTMERESTRLYREARRAARQSGSREAADALAKYGAQVAVGEPSGIGQAGGVEARKDFALYQEKYKNAGEAGYGAGEGGAPAGGTAQQDGMLYGENSKLRKMGGTGAPTTNETTKATAPAYTPAYTSHDQYGAVEHPAVGAPPAAQTKSVAKTSVSNPTTTTTQPTTSVAATNTQDQEPTYSGGKIGGQPAGLVLREMRAKAMEDFKAGKGPEPFGASKSERDYTQFEVAKTGFDARKNATPADATMGPSMDMQPNGSLLRKAGNAAAAAVPPTTIPNAAVPASVGITTIEATKAKNPLYDAVGGIAESARPFNTARLIAGKALPAASKLADTFAIGKAGEAFKLGGQLAGMQGHVADTATDIAKLTKDLGVANKGVTAAESGVAAAKAAREGLSAFEGGNIGATLNPAAKKIVSDVAAGLLKPEEVSKAASRGISAAKNAVETAKGAVGAVDETIAGTARAGEMAQPFLKALEKSAPLAQKVSQYATTGANILRPLAPVARVAGKLALPLQIGMEALDTGRFFKDQEFQDRTIQGMEDFGNQGRQAFGEGGTLGQKAAYVGSALEQGLSPMKTLLALGAQSTKMRGSMEDASRAEAGATTAQNRFQATQNIFNQPAIQEQIKGLPIGSKERLKFFQDIRKRVQVK